MVASPRVVGALDDCCHLFFSRSPRAEPPLIMGKNVVGFKVKLDTVSDEVSSTFDMVQRREMGR